MKKLFLEAARVKLRFQTTKGLMSTEDLFDLPLTGTVKVNLNSMAKALNKALRAAGDEENFVTFASAVVSKEQAENQLRFDIVKAVIEIKVIERDIERNASAKKVKKTKILGLIAAKQDEIDGGKTLDELTKELDELD